MGEETQGFVIRDRRGQSESRASEQAGSSTISSRPNEAPAQPAASAASDTAHGAHIPATFSSFVISMGSSALMLMGEQLSPQQQAVPVNLPQAKEIIDLLSMLEDKTRGNLTSDEQGVLEDMLYALRMKFVSLSSGQQPTRTP
jgi:hypothetical protein